VNLTVKETKTIWRPCIFYRDRWRCSPLHCSCVLTWSLEICLDQRWLHTSWKMLGILRYKILYIKWV